MHTTGQEPGPAGLMDARRGGPGRKQRTLGVVLLLLLILLASLSLYRTCQGTRRLDLDARYAPRGQVNLQEPQGEEPQPSMPHLAQGALRVAIAPVVSPEKSMEKYHALVRWLAERLELRPVFMQRQTYGEVNDLVRYRQCDLALVCTYAYIRGQREFGMEILAVPQIRGKLTYQSYIIVRTASRATSLLDLAGKRFASADILSSSGWLYPSTWLIGRGLNPKTFFSAHILSGSHDRSIQAVATGDVDGAAVDSMVFEEMVSHDAQLAANLQVIQRSAPFGMPPLVVHPQLESALKQRLLQALLELSDDAQAQRLLKPLGFDRFVRPDGISYDSVRAAASIWEGHP